MLTTLICAHRTRGTITVLWPVRPVVPVVSKQACITEEGDESGCSYLSFLCQGFCCGPEFLMPRLFGKATRPRFSTVVGGICCCPRKSEHLESSIRSCSSRIASCFVRQFTSYLLPKFVPPRNSSSNTTSSRFPTTPVTVPFSPNGIGPLSKRFMTLSPRAISVGHDSWREYKNKKNKFHFRIIIIMMHINFKY